MVQIGWLVVKTPRDSSSIFDDITLYELCRAILGYVYKALQLADTAEEYLQKLKARGPKGPQKTSCREDGDEESHNKALNADME